MNQLLKQVLLVCVCLFASADQAIADSLSDAQVAQHFNDAGNYTKAAGTRQKMHSAKIQGLLINAR